MKLGEPTEAGSALQLLADRETWFTACWRKVIVTGALNWSSSFDYDECAW
jgi:hypothetical protein